jgi:hypothetical protein
MDNSSAPNLDTLPQEKSPEPNYMLNGLIIGIIISLGVIGVIYYKNNFNRSIALNNQNQSSAASNQFIIPFFNRIGSKADQVTPTPVPSQQVQPTVTPVKVETKQDLIMQQNALDITDMKGVLTDLEKNSKDSLQFAQ